MERRDQHRQAPGGMQPSTGLDPFHAISGGRRERSGTGPLRDALQLLSDTGARGNRRERLSVAELSPPNWHQLGGNEGEHSFENKQSGELVRVANGSALELKGQYLVQRLRALLGVPTDHIDLDMTASPTALYATLGRGSQVTDVRILNNRDQTVLQAGLVIDLILNSRRSALYQDRNGLYLRTADSSLFFDGNGQPCTLGPTVRAQEIHDIATAPSQARVLRELYAELFDMRELKLSRLVPRKPELVLQMAEAAARLSDEHIHAITRATFEEFPSNASIPPDPRWSRITPPHWHGNSAGYFNWVLCERRDRVASILSEAVEAGLR